MSIEKDNEITTDTNGKLTITLYTEQQILYVWFEDCLISTSTLKHITIADTLIFIDGMAFDKKYFCIEQINFLYQLKRTKHL
jgi:hypothetical protein